MQQAEGQDDKNGHHENGVHNNGNYASPGSGKMRTGIPTLLLPDGEEGLKKQLIRLADQRQLDLILTTGGTGFAPRDVTPEATCAVCDRMANGIADAIRNYSMTVTDRAMFSRAVSGIRKKTLIINLPGSPKAVTEALEYILPRLPHGLDVLRGNVQECGRK